VASSLAELCSPALSRRPARARLRHRVHARGYAEGEVSASGLAATPPLKCPNCSVIRSPADRRCPDCGHAYESTDDVEVAASVPGAARNRLTVADGFRFGLGFIAAVLIVGTVYVFLAFAVLGQVVGALTRPLIN
jgi:hypothetical protein